MYAVIDEILISSPLDELSKDYPNLITERGITTTNMKIQPYLSMLSYVRLFAINNNKKTLYTYSDSLVYIIDFRTAFIVLEHCIILLNNDQVIWIETAGNCITYAQIVKLTFLTPLVAKAEEMIWANIEGEMFVQTHKVYMVANTKQRNRWALHHIIGANLFEVRVNNLIKSFVDNMCELPCNSFSEVVEYVEHIEEKSDEFLCKVCYDLSVKVVFLPCKHLCCCEKCSESLLKCCVCATAIDSKLVVFIS
jgi:hypothetical protein